MPELPEVETVRRGLQRLIIGKEVTTVTHDTPKSFPNAATDIEEFLIGATITECAPAQILKAGNACCFTQILH